MGKWKQKSPGQKRRLRQRVARENRQWSAQNGPVTVVQVGNWRHHPKLTDEYREYMASERWTLTKVTYFAAEGHTCLGCKASNNIDLHHLTYRHFQNEWWTDLIPLCRPCHERVHRGRIALFPKEHLLPKPILPIS